jgi:membrane-associated phospholipid phosphatase
MKIVIIMLLSIFNFTNTIAAEQAPVEQEVASFELLDDFLSPFTTKAKHPLIIGILTTGLAIALFEDKIYGEYQEAIVEKDSLGDASKYFDYFGQGIPNALYIGYWYYDYKKNGSAKSKSRSTHMLKSTLHAVAMTTMLKHTIRERRPPPSDNRDSFPSGHTTSAFAFASVVATNHSTFWGATAYTLASIAGYSRINDNRHYIHDVLTGATIGISYGLSIHYRNQEKSKKSSKGSTAYLVAPTEDYQGAQFAMIRAF